MRSLIVAGMLSGSLALVGCDDGAPGPRSRECRAFCAKLEICDDGTDRAGCEIACDAQVVRSELYLAARRRCAEQSSCNIWVGEVGPMGEDLCADGASCQLNDCTDDELARRERTREERSYCARVVSKLSACDTAALEPATLETHCMSIVSSLSSRYLDEMQDCSEEDCGQVASCLRELTDRYNTTLSLYPPGYDGPS